MDKIVYKKEVYDEETGSIKDVVLLSAPPSNGGNGNGEPTSDWSDLIEFIPKWRVGASGGYYADPGLGRLQGWYKKRSVTMIPIEGGTKFSATEVELFIELVAHNPTIPTGEGFEIEVPEELRPANDDFARGGGGDLWIRGGENSHAISPKWTDRKGRPMRIIILGSGWEWTTTVPRAIAIDKDEKTASLFFWMKYLK